MSNYVERMTADGYCDFCRTNLEGYKHEDWCPIVEIERLRAALREIADGGHPGPSAQKVAEEALGDE